MTQHCLNLPWRIEGRTLFDSTGVPVAVVLDYTSVRRIDSDGTLYNTSEYASAIRAEAICAAINRRARTVHNTIPSTTTVSSTTGRED